MSLILELSEPHDGHGYRVVHRERCVIVYGQIPLSEAGALLGTASQDAVMDNILASRLGATMAFGERADLDRLREDSKAESLARITARLGGEIQRLSTAEVEWLAYGERGRSSDSIFQHVHGISLHASDQLSAPGNPGDLRRCRLLLELSPTIRAKFKSVMAQDVKWKALIEHWDDLCTTMDEESPDWRDPDCGQASPNTRKKIFELTAS